MSGNRWTSQAISGIQSSGVCQGNQPTERQIAKNAVPLPDTDVLQMAGGGAGNPKNGNRTSNLQMAADRTGSYSLRRPLVLPILSLSLRDVEELLDERGLQADHTTALGTAVRPRTGATHPAASQADQQILARGRDLRSRAGPLVLPVSGHRFGRRHY